MNDSAPIEVIAQVTIKYHSELQLNGIKAKLPPGITPVIDLILKRVQFTVVQEISEF